MKAPPLPISAKVARPNAAGLVERERLFQRLDHLTAAQALWVTAPAGAGKTSLVSSWLEARGRPTLWMRLDAGDADPATFFHYLARGAATVSVAAATLPPLTPEYLPNLPFFVRRFFTSLGPLLPESSVIVLDNWQEVPSSAPLARVLDTAIGALPPGVALVVLSRTPPHAALANWARDPDFAQIGWDELRLTDDEAVAIAHKDDKTIEPLHARAIAAQVRGWAAGLRLLLAAQARGVAIDAAPSTAQQSIVDYFAGEVFARLAAHEREWLVKCACAPNGLSARAADAAAGAGAANYLAALHASRYFVDRRADAHGASIFEFHPLFREFLL